MSSHAGTDRRVVVTGIGLLTALGEGAAATWDGLTAGRCGVRTIDSYDPSPLETRLGATMPGFDPSRYLSRRELRTLTREDQFAVAATSLALTDAGIDTGHPMGERAGLYLGGDKEIARMDDFIAGLYASRRADGEIDMRRLGSTASSTFRPLFYVEGLQPAAVFHVSRKFGIRGSNAYLHGSADSGAMAVGRAYRAVRRGDADTVVAGGFSEATSWWFMAKTDVFGLMTTRNELGDRACRPFDVERTGSVLGEGAALLVLEEREHALARGARVYAEITGLGGGNDCARAPAPDPRGRGVVRAVRRALGEAGVTHPDYIAAHGSGTTQGDASETRALHEALGDRAGIPAVSSVKPQTGHLSAGAGALNSAVCALSLHSGHVPATRNLDKPAPECDLNLVRSGARRTEPRTAMALARGVEGQAVALLLTRDSG